MPMPRFDWELTILDAEPPVADRDGLGSTAVGDVDGDGHVEVFVGGVGSLLWYRPATREHGIVAEGQFGVGLAVADVDGDGHLEVAASELRSEGQSRHWCVSWFKPGGALTEPWQRFEIDADRDADGHAHDLLFADVDGDGRLELLANATDGPRRGLYLYRRGDDVARPWPRRAIQLGHKEEGLALVRVTLSGRWAVASGVHLYVCPADGPWSDDPWQAHTVAPSHREMCRVRAIDLTGNGTDDLVIVDSEYLEGQLSWFENRTADGAFDRWVEHPIEHGIYYGHTLHAWRRDGEVVVGLAEMAGGGWNAPYNHDARILEYATSDRGASWRRRIQYQGQGVHEGMYADIDGDGIDEYVGKEHRYARVFAWKRVASPSPIASFRHQFLDLDKPGPGTDIVWADLTGDGTPDVACGRWWYEYGTWRRHELPGVAQVLKTHDINGDGRSELIVTLRGPDGGPFSSLLAWLEPVDPRRDRWRVHEIGRGIGDWPHGSCAGPFGPGGRLALVTSYHSAHASPQAGTPHYPDLWLAPDDPAGPWERRTLAQIAYGEEVVAWDITGSGALDLFCGAWWLENDRQGGFTPHRMFEGLYSARLGVMDVTGNGRPDLIVGDETVDWSTRTASYTPLCWYECPEDPRRPWERHVIDKVRCPHSIGVADLDGDGEMEIICGEHDPFYPYRQRCKLYVYKKADALGRSWRRWTLDDRFEHHDGARPIALPGGRTGILSHGWQDDLYVHLWAPRL